MSKIAPALTKAERAELLDEIETQRWLKQPFWWFRVWRMERRLKDG